MNYGPLCNETGFQGDGIGKYEIGLWLKLLKRQNHGVTTGLIDIDFVYFVGLNLGYGKGQRGLSDLCADTLALNGGELF
jgi:hypothetical protein